MPLHIETVPNHQPIITVRRSGHSHPLPKMPGRYWWTEWNAWAFVYKCPGSTTLWVDPPIAHPIPVKITPRVAGDFLPAQPYQRRKPPKSIQVEKAAKQPTSGFTLEMKGSKRGKVYKKTNSP